MNVVHGAVPRKGGEEKGEYALPREEAEEVGFISFYSAPKEKNEAGENKAHGAFGEAGEA